MQLDKFNEDLSTPFSCIKASFFLHQWTNIASKGMNINDWVSIILMMEVTIFFINHCKGGFDNIFPSKRLPLPFWCIRESPLFSILSDLNNKDPIYDELDDKRFQIVFFKSKGNSKINSYPRFNRYQTKLINTPNDFVIFYL